MEIRNLCGLWASWLCPSRPLGTQAVRGCKRNFLQSEQGGRGWLAFVHRSKIPQSSRRARFLWLRENRELVVVKRLTHTQACSLKHPFSWKKDNVKAGWLLWKALLKLTESSLRTLWKLSESSTKALRKISESGLSKSSAKAGSLKAFWKLYKSSPKADSLKTLSESSTKALRMLSESGLSKSSPKEGSTKALWKLYKSSPKAGSPKVFRKQADFCWKPFKSKLTFVENTPKAGWLL